MKRLTGLALVVATGFASGAVFAAPAPARASSEVEELVPLYTNADLKRFRTSQDSSVPTSSVAAPRTSVEDWRFVQEFIDRQHARLDSERERYSAQREAERFGEPGDRYIAPYAGVYGWGAAPYYRPDSRHDPNAPNIYRHGFGNPDRFPARYARPSARMRDHVRTGGSRPMRDGGRGVSGGGKQRRGGHGGGGPRSGRGH